MPPVRRRRGALRLSDVEQLHERLAEAEGVLALARDSGDAALEGLRGQAAELSVELLQVLGRIRRHLSPQADGQAETAEGAARWVRRQNAGSGVVHQPKPNGRHTKDPVQWPASQAELRRIRAARASRAA